MYWGRSGELVSVLVGPRELGSVLVEPGTLGSVLVGPVGLRRVLGKVRRTRKCIGGSIGIRECTGEGRENWYWSTRECTGVARRGDSYIIISMPGRPTHHSPIITARNNNRPSKPACLSPRA